MRNRARVRACRVLRRFGSRIPEMVGLRREGLLRALWHSFARMLAKHVNVVFMCSNRIAI